MRMAALLALRIGSFLLKRRTTMGYCCSEFPPGVTKGKMFPLGPILIILSSTKNPSTQNRLSLTCPPMSSPPGACPLGNNDGACPQIYP